MMSSTIEETISQNVYCVRPETKSPTTGIELKLDTRWLISAGSLSNASNANPPRVYDSSL